MGFINAYCLFSISRISLKYGCLNACLALSLSSGLYAKSLLMRSIHSGVACGMSFSMPLPDFCGKLKSMCADLCFILPKSSALGVPMMLWIFWIWSSSLVPGKRGNRETISKNTHPTPHMSIL